MGDFVRAGKPTRYVWVDSAFYPPWDDKMSITFWAGNGGCSFLDAYRRTYGSSRSAWSKGRHSHLALLCIHRVNRVNSRNDLSRDYSTVNIVLVLFTCSGRSRIGKGRQSVEYEGLGSAELGSKVYEF